jgi:hypothetical protein
MSADSLNPEQEFDAADRGCAVVERSWVGRLEIRGSDRVDLLHRLSTNDVLKLKEGDVSSTIFVNEKGRIIDYVTLGIGQSSVLVLCSSGNEGRLQKWIDRFCITEDISLTEITHESSIYSLIGPDAVSTARRLFGFALTPNSIREITTRNGSLSVMHVREFGFDCVSIVGRAPAIEDFRMLLSGSHGSAKPSTMGSIAYETFRISRGVPAPGHELSDSFNPYEVNLTHAISFTKGCYIGQEVIARLNSYQKIQRELVGLVFETGRMNLEKNALIRKHGAEIGYLTSISPVSVRGKLIGLGVIRIEGAQTGDTVLVGEQAQAARLAPIPISP